MAKGTLTEKELSALSDLLGGEQYLVKKFTMLANSTQDAAIKSSLQSIAQKHQGHFDMLYRHL